MPNKFKERNQGAGVPAAALSVILFISSQPFIFTHTPARVTPFIPNVLTLTHTLTLIHLSPAYGESITFTSRLTLPTLLRSSTSPTNPPENPNGLLTHSHLSLRHPPPTTHSLTPHSSSSIPTHRSTIRSLSHSNPTVHSRPHAPFQPTQKPNTCTYCGSRLSRFLT